MTDVPPGDDAKWVIRGLSAWFPGGEALRDIALTILDRRVTAILGPEGCGKSTLVRCLNRLNDLRPDCRVRGSVLLDGVDIYSDEISARALRRRVGMVFQRPTPFPAMSIRDNVLAGLRLAGVEHEDEDALVGELLATTGLWESVRHRLHQRPASLSLGERQLLCLARALALQPEVLLLDEPTALLDPVATGHLERVVEALRERCCVVLVTHSMQQAGRVADDTAFLLDGTVVEYAETHRLFTAPRDPRTEAYLTGKPG